MTTLPFPNYESVPFRNRPSLVLRRPPSPSIPFHRLHHRSLAAPPPSSLPIDSTTGRSIILRKSITRCYAGLTGIGCSGAGSSSCPRSRACSRSSPGSQGCGSSLLTCLLCSHFHFTTPVKKCSERRQCQLSRGDKIKYFCI
jgi:hypothetical protein